VRPPAAWVILAQRRWPPRALNGRDAERAAAAAYELSCGKREKKEVFFFEKKKQKTFIRLVRLLERVLALRQIDKSFCFFFSKKKTSFSS